MHFSARTPSAELSSRCGRNLNANCRRSPHAVTRVIAPKLSQKGWLQVDIPSCDYAKKQHHGKPHREIVRTTMQDQIWKEKKVNEEREPLLYRNTTGTHL